MTILISTATHENLNYRLSSILTIGFISQEINPGNLTIEEVNNVLNVLTMNLNHQSDEVVTETISSFLNFIIFANQNMNVEGEKSYILSNIYNCLSHSNLKIRILSMQCLVEISRIYYDSIASNIDDIIPITKKHVFKNNLDAK